VNKRKLLPVLLTVFLGISFLGKVDARGGVFLIEPKQEVIDSIELTVSDKTSANVAGSMSVANGSIDFYVTSPSGIVLFCYNNTDFEKFNFTALENGTFVMHLLNTQLTNNVTATLDYGVNWKITLQAAMTFHATSNTVVTTETALVEPSPINNIIEILKAISLIATIISTILGIFGIKLYIGRKKKVEYIREFGTVKSTRQKQKQRKN
jgi:hypothetical protein